MPSIVKVFLSFANVRTLIALPALFVPAVALSQNPGADAKSLLAKAQVEAGHITSAEKKRSAISAIAMAYIKVGDFAGAQAIIESIKDPYNKSFAIASLAGALAKGGNHDAARKYFNIALDNAKALPGKLETDDLKGFVFQVIGQEMAKSGETEDAIALAKTLGNTEYRPHILLTVALAQARSGKKELSKKTFAEAIQYANKLDGPFQASAMSAIAEAQAQAGESTNASKTADQISGGEEVQGIGQSAAGRALADKGDVEGLKKLIASSKDDRSRADLLAMLADALYKSGDKPGAKSAIRESFVNAAKVADPTMRADILIAIAETQARGGDTDDSKATLTRAIRAANQDPSGANFGDITRRIAVVQVRLGMTEEALVTIDALEGIFFFPALGDVAEAHTKKSGAADALKWMDKFDTPEHKTRWLIGMALGVFSAK